MSDTFLSNSVPESADRGPAGDGGRTSVTGSSVLIVEPEAELAAALGRALERRGHRVAHARSLEEALAAPRPDIVVSEIDSDGLDGLELLRRMSAAGRPPRTVLLTACASEEDTRLALRLGAAELLVKPLRLEQVVAAVEGESARPREGSQRRPARVFARRFPADATRIEAVARELCAFALRHGVAPAARCRIGSAACELLDNACRHSGAAGALELRARLDERMLTLTVGDHGFGLDDPRAARAAAERARSGLHRVACLADGFWLFSEPGRGTIASASFRIGRVVFEEARQVDLSELDFLVPETTRRVLRALERGSEPDLLHLSPALAVSIGRLLAATPPSLSSAQD